jgi:tRNA nucleotidyltransferase (CCA-adding enzyme)
MLILPDHIQRLIAALAERGVEAYAVGGCVRDSLLGLAPSDWDIAASAKPEIIIKILGGELTGGKCGTVTVEGIQVTPFRREGGYTDHRRPGWVEFTADLETDLARRDFTVNAMAAGLSGSVIDPFGGQDDLRSKLIRCVGDPFTRFEEDALRILRAVRFCAALDFSLEENTRTALMEKLGTLDKLSKKVILDETGKLIAALYAAEKRLDG